MHDRLLPILGSTQAETITASLAFAGLRTNLLNLYIEQRFDSLSHIKLVRIAMNLECILVIANRTVTPFSVTNGRNKT